MPYKPPGGQKSKPKRANKAPKKPITAKRKVDGDQAPPPSTDDCEHIVTGYINGYVERGKISKPKATFEICEKCMRIVSVNVGV